MPALDLRPVLDLQTVEPEASKPQFAGDKTPLMQRPALDLLVDEEAFGGIPRIPSIGKEVSDVMSAAIGLGTTAGPAIRTSAEFAGGLEESVLGGLSGMTSRESMLALPAFSIPFVGPGLALGLGAQALGAGAGTTVAGIEQGEPRTVGSGIGTLGVAGLMIHGGVKGARQTPAPTRAGAIGRAGEAVGRTIAPFIPEGTAGAHGARARALAQAERLAPLTTEAAKQSTTEVPSAIPKRSAEKVSLGETPGSSPEVERQVRSTETSAVSQEQPGKPAPAETRAEVPRLTPAIQVAGKIFTGEDHVNAYENAKSGGQPDTSGAQEGFVNEKGEFLSREKAAADSGLPTATEPGKLHSTDLPPAKPSKPSYLTEDEWKMQSDTRDELDLPDKDYRDKAGGRAKIKRFENTRKLTDFLKSKGIEVAEFLRNPNDHISHVVEQYDGSYEVRVEHHTENTVSAELVNVKSGESLSNPGKPKFIEGVGTRIIRPDGTISNPMEKAAAAPVEPVAEPTVPPAEAPKAETDAPETAPAPEQNSTRAQFLADYVALAKKVRSAEKEPDRPLSPEERELHNRDWKAFSRQRGYTEGEIADMERLGEMATKAGQYGLSSDDLWESEFNAGLTHPSSAVPAPEPAKPPAAETTYEQPSPEPKRPAVEKPIPEDGGVSQAHGRYEIIKGADGTATVLDKEFPGGPVVVKSFHQRNGLELAQKWVSEQPAETPATAPETAGPVAKPTAQMTASEINKELDRLSTQSSKITDQMIAEGRGSERPSDYEKKTDPLSVQARATSERIYDLRQEIKARYGPNAPSRLPTRGFGPREKAAAETPATAPKEPPKELIIGEGGEGYLNLKESESTPLALGRIKASNPKRFADIQRYFKKETPGEIAKAASERFNQMRAASETPAVPPPDPPRPPSEFGMAAGAPLGGRRFGLDMANLWQDIKALWQRRPIKRDMAQLADAMIDTIPANKGREAGNELRVLTQQRVRGRLQDSSLARKAAVFVIQAKGDPAKLATDLVKVAGHADAEAAIRYAQANWDALQPLANRTKLLLDEQIQYERANGIETEYENHYVPQRHENILTDRGVLFGETRSGTGSTGFKKAKVFPDYASAIEAGYIPRNLDIADLVEHRVRTGQRLVNRKLWADGFRTIDDPYSGEPIITDMVARRIPRPDGTVDTQYSAPAGYTVKDIIPGVRIAVRQGYVHLFNALTGTSQIRESALGRGALAVAGYEKHILLLLDSFHVSRTMQTSVATHGTATYNKGLSLIEYSDRALSDAVNHNLVTSEMAAWIRTPQPFEIGGVTTHMTPREVAQLGQRNGLNVGRFGDVLYNAAGNIVGRNPATKWIFEKLTRGAMVESFLSEFGRIAKSNPTMDATAVARQVARDMNVLFGNLQRQSFIKNPAFRDLMQIAFLAPQWVESLARRELRAASQTAQAGIGLVSGKGLHVGTVAKTIGTGLAAYVALTQLLNYIFQGHSTFENKQEGSKLDAIIPDRSGESEGFRFSPLSVFGEITHDVIRYSRTEPTLADAIQRIVENKLGPLARAIEVARTGRDSIGTKLPTTWDRAKEAGLQAIPSPIGVKPVAQVLGKELGVPGIGKPRPGALVRQAASSVGLKIEPYKAAEGKIKRAREVNTYIEYWKKQARQLPMSERRVYLERAMNDAKFSPQERHKTKREIGESGVLKYQ